MLGGNACFRKEGDRIEGTEHRLPSLLKTGAQAGVLLQYAQPADKEGLEGALRALHPDGRKKLDERTGLADQAGRSAVGLSLSTQ